METHNIITTWKGNMQFESTNPSGDVISIDAGPENGGEGKGLRPKALMLSALAGCTGLDVASLMEKMKLEVADFKIENQDGTIVHLKPENRLYKVENSLSQEVDIFSFIFYDLYAVISRVDKTNIHAKIYFQPFISFIWSAISIISLSFFLLLRSKKKL